jgi:TPR repeat protein
MGADRGCAHSQHNLGLILRKEGNHDDALRLFKMAAEKGYTNAEEVMGQCYGMGEGVEVNLAEAKRWWERAAAKGDECAISNLLVLRSQNL